jgi:hypothetical protein
MSLKCSVAGRFLWQLGTTNVSKLGIMSLQNCAFVKIDEPIKPFLWIFKGPVPIKGNIYNRPGIREVKFGKLLKKHLRNKSLIKDFNLLKKLNNKIK